MHKHGFPLIEQALANASPLSVRRIQNKIIRDKDVTKRYSAAHAESLGSIPKIVNQGVAPHQDSSRPHLHASDSNIHSISPALLDSEANRKKLVRHTYEDVEIGAKEDMPQDSRSNSRTVNWVNHHTELNWGRGEGRGEDQREIASGGSIWSTRNRMQRQQSKEKLRNGGGARRLSKSRSDQGRELIGSYQPTAPPPGPRTYRQHPPSSSVPQPYPQTSRQPEETTPPQAGVTHRTYGQGEKHKSRRVSYLSAMDDPSDIPVRDNPSGLPLRHTIEEGHQLRPTREEGHQLRPTREEGHQLRPTREEGHQLRPTREEGHQLRSTREEAYHRPSRDEQYTSPEYNLPTYTAGGGRHGNNRPMEGYNVYQPRPLSSHGIQHGYNSLQRDVPPQMNPVMGRRRSSESSEPPLERGSRGNQYYRASPGRTHLHAVHARRTFSNERSYSNDSPPQREHPAPDHTHHPHPRRPAQVESFL